MRTSNVRENYFLLGMTALSVLLAGVLFWEWKKGLELRAELLQLRKMPVTSVPPQKILPEFSLPDFETGFPELLARPIFSVSRRVVPATAQTEVSVMKKGQFALVGVLIFPGHRSALLRDVTTGKTEGVAQAGVIRGMTVGQVLPGRMILRQGEESEELILNVQTGAKPPQRPQVAPAANSVSPPAPAASAPKAPASAAPPATIPATPSTSGSSGPAIRPPTALELIQAERQKQAALDQMKRQMPSVPAIPSSATPK